jgi:hypothetical protein
MDVDTFEKIIKQSIPMEETFICQNCNEEKSIEEKGTSELAMNDCICEECMEVNDYGK